MPIKNKLIGLTSTTWGLYILTGTAKAQCTDLSVQGGANCAKGNSTAELTSTIANIVNTMLFIAGIAAVIAIIIGGLRYILSQGNEKAIEGAKSTILYAVIGLIVTVLAYAIVNFVITEI